MLVLTRKLGQNILIGENVTVKVLKIDNNKVQLGISAPRSVPIYRQELIDKIREFNQLALKTNHLQLRKAAIFLKQIFKV